MDLKKRFSEEQIIGFLRQAEAGVAIKELCRQHGFSDASFYNWPASVADLVIADCMFWFGEKAFRPITSGFIGSTAMKVFPFVVGSGGMVWLSSGRPWSVPPGRTRSGDGFCQ